MVTIKDGYVSDDEKLDAILSDLEHNLKTLFENDKDMLAEIINGVTGIPKEDIIERGILLDSQDLINPEKVKKYKDSDILINKSDFLSVSLIFSLTYSLFIITPFFITSSFGIPITSSIISAKTSFSSVNTALKTASNVPGITSFFLSSGLFVYPFIVTKVPPLYFLIRVLPFLPPFNHIEITLSYVIFSTTFYFSPKY